MPSKDVEQILNQLEQMMSHGIFDAEVIAAKFRTDGWKFVRDPELDDPELTGGKYVIRTPEGREGTITWHTAAKVEELIGNAGFFMEGKAPRALFLAWILAQELAMIIFGIDVEESAGPNPGPMFKMVYEWMQSAQGGWRDDDGIWHEREVSLHHRPE
jgi:hypothetical protein